MALKGYCKKCDREVPAGTLCPYCGTKLGTNGVRIAWCMEHTPVKDWMCWNEIMRLLLPGIAGIVLLILLGEGLSGGEEAIDKMMNGGVPLLLVWVLALAVLLTFLGLLLQGKDIVDVIVDGRGIHVTTYVNEPTRLKMMARLKWNLSEMNLQGGVVAVKQQDLAWKDVARVQLWPEKCLILFYAPRGWMRISIPCTPFTWQDALDVIREKIGKKKKVLMPAMLRVAQQRSSTPRRTRPGAVLIPEVEEAIEQITMEEVIPEEAVQESFLPENEDMPVFEEERNNETL